ncbi:MAG TPA: efflux transporter outer membrane subunit, partial [Opitutus sp.]|nr:efflux transporter outer membrane subunit [Opitutus sp.]
MVRTLFPGPRPLILLLALCAGSCAVGPNYHRPTAPTPEAYKEAAGWKPAAPADDAIRGPWWEMFADAKLNELEAQAATANQTIAEAAANYEQARQLARASRSTLFPTVSIAGSAQRAKTPASRTSLAAGRIENSFTASAGASWTPDFWGRIRRTTESNLAAAQASAADLASARLAVESELAQTYFQLRVTDERLRLRQNAVEAYGRTLQIAQNKYRVGIVARSDVISAQALLDAARAQVIDTRLQRAQLEHALAVLLGRPPADFALDAEPALSRMLPAIPPQLPADLLQRRPDIAAAERSVAVANARVGLNTAAYFPDLALSATGGYESNVLHRLLSAPNQFWSIGADLGDTLF